MSLRFDEKTAGEQALILQQKLSATRTGNLGYRLEAVRGLGECGRVGVDALCDMLTDPEPAMQAAAAEALAIAGDKRAVPPLVSALREAISGAKARFQSRLLLWIFGALAAVVALGLLAPSPLLYWLLGPIGACVAGWMAASLLNEDLDGEHRLSALGAALEAIAERDATAEIHALPGELRKVSQDLMQPQYVRSAASTAALRIEGVIERLPAWQGPRLDRAVLARLTPEEAAADIERWTPKVRHGHEAARIKAARKLGELGPGAVDPLAGALQDRLPTVRAAAAQALGFIGDDRACDTLCAALGDGDVRVRAAVAQGLGEIGDERAIEPLAAALRATFRRGSAKGQRILGQRLRGVMILVAIALFLVLVYVKAHPFSFIQLGTSSIGWILTLSLRRTSVEQGPAVRAIILALSRIADRSTAPQLAALAEELRQVSLDKVHQDDETRKVSAEAAARLEQVAATTRSLPIAAAGIGVQAESLPLPARAVEPETGALPRTGG